MLKEFRKKELGIYILTNKVLIKEVTLSSPPFKKNTMKKVLGSIILSFFALGTLQAQQDAQFTNYMYNTLVINPAYAGSRGTTSLFGLNRKQWLGLEGAPTTNTFAIHAPFKDSNVGLGLSVINDVIGPSVENTISADYSYTINTSNTYKLAFGLRGTAHLLNVDFTKLNIYNQGDALAQYNIANQFSPNFGFGAYWYSEDTYFGFSTPNLIKTKHFDKVQATYSASSVPYERRHYYFIAGKVFDIDPSLQFKPAVLAKIVEGAPIGLDISANFLIKEKFTLGAAYRWSAAVSMLAGFQISSNWFIGYGYDTETTKLANYNSGSHELFLRYELTRKKQVMSPRFF
jgi:type IX secretion system PorP/SprF family membrane protein